MSALVNVLLYGIIAPLVFLANGAIGYAVWALILVRFHFPPLTFWQATVAGVLFSGIAWVIRLVIKGIIASGGGSK